MNLFRYTYLTARFEDVHNYLFKDILININHFLSHRRHWRSRWIEFQSCVLHAYSELAGTKKSVCLTLDTNLEREKKLVEKPYRQKLMITPPRWCWRGTSLPSPLSRLLDMPCKVNDTILKHFLIKIERRTFFFCLQAVNYLTSTHNEQCKTSRNLIKRQRQGPSADGKWLTQLIKHPSVRLNMASLSHHLREGWDPLHISIFPFACGTCIAFISLTPIYSAFFHKGIYVSLMPLSNFPSSVNLNGHKCDATSFEDTVKCGVIRVVFKQRFVWFELSEVWDWKTFGEWKKKKTPTQFITQAL